jgi:translocation and assembly module TamB
MATAARPDHGAQVVVRLLGGIALVLLALILLALVALAGLNTGPGRSFVARQLAGLAPESGLTIDVGRLEGSLYGRLLIRDLRVGDPKGTFATAPLVVLDWRPAALIQRHVQIESLTAETVRVLRLPTLNETTTEGPILPDIDITVGRLAIDRILLEPPVAGRRHVLALEGRANIADRRAVVSADARSAAGDRLNLKLDAVPDDNRFDIDATLTAPVGGIIESMVQLGRPLDARIAGAGDWASWRGTITGRFGGTPLVDLALTGREGNFTVAGTARPSLLVAGAPARLLAPEVRIDGTAALAERRADISLRAVSSALDVAARGRIDLAASRFGALRVDALVLRPEAMFDDTRGSDIRLALVLDGPFATPVVGYRIDAAALAFGTTGVERLHAEGRTKLARAGPIIVPLSATVARVTGVDEAIGGVLRNLQLDGDLRVTPEQLLSDSLRLRSDRLDATLVLAYSFATGRYDLALKGSINRYVFAGLGVLDLVTDARLAPTAAGEMGIRGNVVARVRRLDSAGLRDTLGGLPTLSAAFERLPDGTIRFSRGRLTAPKLRVTDASGIYRPDGRLTLSASGSSTDYGPFTVRAEGPAARPTIRLRAARPNVGVPLTNLDVVLTPTRAGYAISARGGSPYGPIAARAQLALGGALALDIEALQVAGLTARGRVTQTAAGPFAGRLAIVGSGITGTVQLAAAGAIQRVDANLRADQARIPLSPEPVLIARGAADATLLLNPDTPSIEARASVEGLRRGPLALARAEAQARYRGGSGTATLSAEGRNGVPFTLAADAGFAPGRIRIGASGSANRIELRLAQPAEFVAVRGGWQLRPATLLLGTGRAELSGTFANDTRVNARLINIDLGITRAFSPDLRLGGRLSGDVAAVLPARGAPQLRSGLAILGLTRSSLAGTSRPVDLGFNAALAASGGAVRARLRRGTQLVGQLQARLAPLPGNASDPVMERLLAAPFAGNFRYDGPAEALWALSGVTGHEVRGPLVITADFGGRLSEPRLTGTARAQGLRYDNLAFGTSVRNIALDSRFAGSRFDLLSLTGATGDEGRIEARGTADLSASRGFPADFQAQFRRARVARRDDLAATITGPLRLTNGPRGADVKGDLRIDSARYGIARETGAADIPTLAVRRVQPPGAVPPRPPVAAAPSMVRLAVRARANNGIRAEGMGLESEWRADVEASGTSTTPRLVGTIDLVRGTFSFAGRRFELTRGVVHLTGANPPDPTVDIVAEAEVDDLTATITVSGTAQAPQIAFASVPALPQDEVLSRLLFGQSVTELSAVQALQLASSLASLRGGGGGLNPIGKLRQATGFDRFRILGSDREAGRGTAVAIGENLGENVYVEITTDVRGYTATQLEIALTRALSLITQVGGSGGTNLGVRYGKDY